MDFEIETEVTITLTLNKEEAKWLKRLVHNALPNESSQDYTRRDLIWSYLKEAGIE